MLCLLNFKSSILLLPLMEFQVLVYALTKAMQIAHHTFCFEVMNIFVDSIILPVSTYHLMCIYTDTNINTNVVVPEDSCFFSTLSLYMPNLRCTSCAGCSPYNYYNSYVPSFYNTM